MNFEDIKVKLDAPYPEIENAIEDKNTVAILKSLATSNTGELEAVLQYTYQYVTVNNFNYEIADILEEISIVEMMHLDMLMHAIVDFGGLPKYEDGQGKTYNASNINYTLRLREMLENNIRGEEFAINQYTRAINLVSNKSLKELFRRIIEDERRHIEVFKTIRDNVTFLSI